MTANRWILLVVAALIMFGTYWYEDEIRPGLSQQPVQTASSTGQTQASTLANPASTNCVDTLGGTLDIVDTAQGSAGYCHLKDGRVCEEWALFQSGTCNPEQ